MFNKLITVILSGVLMLCIQSYTVPKNTSLTDYKITDPNLRETVHNSILGNNSAKKNVPENNPVISKNKKGKSSLFQKKYRRKKVPLTVKLGIIFLGIGLIALIASFWGWLLTVYTLNGLAGWVPQALAVGIGSMGAGLVLLIISWLAN